MWGFLVTGVACSRLGQSQTFDQLGAVGESG